MPRPFWHADIHADRRPFLLGRGRIKAALRGWFAGQGFTEVECGAVQLSPGNETHLHGFPVTWRPEGGAEQTLYLHTSPEFAAKKLLAAGETQIVDLPASGAMVSKARCMRPNSPWWNGIAPMRTGQR
ncbi:MAG: hypothetical protein MUE77_09175 [Sandarakinorhabdus sp.]|nr:hypothetical protein [Sandarakinorhabdus sp.]